MKYNYLLNQQFAPFYLSLIFFPLGVILCFKLNRIKAVDFVVSIAISTLILFYSVNITTFSKNSINILLSINIMISIFLLGFGLDLENDDPKLHQDINPSIFRWVVSPVVTLIAYYAIVMFLQAEEKIGGFDLDYVFEYLWNNKILSLMFTSWFIYLLFVNISRYSFGRTNS